MKLVETLRIFLGRPWAGLVLVLLVFVLGLLAARALPMAAWLLFAVAGLMLIGMGVSWFKAQGLPPAPGRIYDINGRKVHIYAEGERGDNHPVIWVAGGHGEGLIMNHLHKAIRDETRSILFDRTGSGWTGPANEPVTISGEVEQLKLLLERAGEEGPFVLAGHSFGGMFSANFAHHYPELVAGVVLLDSTPPWNVAYVGKLSFSTVLRKAWWGALASHFGLSRLTEPEIDDPNSDLARELQDVAVEVNAHSVQAKSLLAEASVFKSTMENPLDLVIGKGALGDIPLLFISANPTSEELAELRRQLTDMMGLTELQADNLMDGLRDSVDQQVALSSRGRQMMMPEGATHMFPYEYPGLVLEEVRKMVRHSAPLEH
jgi:pimeloyl-ACP methyl ester carboxylesterase